MALGNGIDRRPAAGVAVEMAGVVGRTVLGREMHKRTQDKEDLFAVVLLHMRDDGSQCSVSEDYAPAFKVGDKVAVAPRRPDPAPPKFHPLRGHHAMTMPHTRATTVAHALLLLSLTSGLLGSVAWAAPPAAASGQNEVEARYRADRAACLSGAAGQDREACLREAGAVRAEAQAAARRPSPAQPEPDYAANALARCERVPERDRAECRLMVQGHGTRQGSVAEGAIMYELVTRSSAPAASAASAP